MDKAGHKERLFYLDFIRAVAVLLIFFTHYDAIFYFHDPSLSEKTLLPTFPFHTYIGVVGVSLFIIISGAALMYVYQDKLDLLKFYKKRFLSIYPMFWIAFSLAFLINFFIFKGTDNSIKSWKIILSIIGFDGYLGDITRPNFYIVGEWFTGFIILVYLLFPIIRIGVLKKPKITATVILTLYFISVYCYKGSMSTDKVLLNRIPELAFGMYEIKYFGKKIKKLFIPSIVFLVLNCCGTFPNNSMHRGALVGISLFIVLIGIAEIVKTNKLLASGIHIMAKYSYAFFLVHHIIIYRISSSFDLMKISHRDNIILFFLCLFVTIIFTEIVYKINHTIIRFISTSGNEIDA